MFTRIGTNGVHSSEGFEVENVDSSCVVYREGSQTLTVRVEESFSGKWPVIKLQQNAFSHWDHSATTLTPKKQAQMRKNFVAAMLFLGVAVEL